MIKLADAKRVVDLHAKALDAHEQLRILGSSPPARASMEILVRMSNGSTRPYALTGPEITTAVLGYVRRHHRNRLNDALRELRAMNAEIPAELIGVAQP